MHNALKRWSSYWCLSVWLNDLTMLMTIFFECPCWCILNTVFSYTYNAQILQEDNLRTGGPPGYAGTPWGTPPEGKPPYPDGGGPEKLFVGGPPGYVDIGCWGICWWRLLGPCILLGGPDMPLGGPDILLGGGPCMLLGGPWKFRWFPCILVGGPAILLGGPDMLEGGPRKTNDCIFF